MPFACCEPVVIATIQQTPFLIFESFAKIPLSAADLLELAIPPNFVESLKMSWKPLNQYSLADGLVVEHDAVRELDEVGELIDWDELEQQVSAIHAKTRGRSAYPPLLLLKALILQAWYNLSDPGLERQLGRDLLFRRFVGLGLSEAVPDHTTLWRFRQELAAGDRLSAVLKQINDQLAVAGVRLQQGQISIVDATVIEAKQCRPHRKGEGETTQDPEAAYHTKANSRGQRRTTYGYKLHANSDEDGFVQGLDYSPANHHDSRHFGALLTGEEAQVYGDSAYASDATDKLLGKKNKITHRAYRNRPLTGIQKRQNRQRATIRSTVERVFGQMKLHQGLGKARYLGLARNRVRAELIAISHNLKTALGLCRGMARLRERCA